MLPPDIPVFDAHPPRATASRPVSRRFSAALLVAALLAVCCGGALIARHLHHASRPIPTAWFAPVDFAAVHGLAGGRP